MRATIARCRRGVGQRRKRVGGVAAGSPRRVHICGGLRFRSAGAQSLARVLPLSGHPASHPVRRQAAEVLEADARTSDVLGLGELAQQHPRLHRSWPHLARARNWRYAGKIIAVGVERTDALARATPI
jgi:hypothetical protein